MDPILQSRLQAPRRCHVLYHAVITVHAHARNPREHRNISSKECAHQQIGDVMTLVADHSLEASSRLKQQKGSHTLVNQVCCEVRPCTTSRQPLDLNNACAQALMLSGVTLTNALARQGRSRVQTVQGTYLVVHADYNTQATQLLHN